jgi:hypothetical protein
MNSRRRALARLVALPCATALCARAAGSGGSDAARIAFAELYGPRTVLGIELAPKTRALAGQRVQILGYLAPPLRPDVAFFVLTRSPVALCPFCNSDADWPSDIVVVYPRKGGGWTQEGLPMAVSGTLELGSKVDSRTGFASLVRIVDADVEALR